MFVEQGETSSGASLVRSRTKDLSSALPGRVISLGIQVLYVWPWVSELCMALSTTSGTQRLPRVRHI